MTTTNATITSLGERFGCKVIELVRSERDALRDTKYHTGEDGTFDYTHFSCMGYSYVANVFYNKMNSLALADPQWFCIRKNKS